MLTHERTFNILLLLLLCNIMLHNVPNSVVYYIILYYDIIYKLYDDSWINHTVK